MNDRVLYRATVEIDGDDYHRLSDTYSTSQYNSVGQFLEEEVIPCALDSMEDDQ